VLQQLYDRFELVEVWCDCRASEGTPYSAAEEMVEEYGLDGPAWGECETQTEGDHAYGPGFRRMVGNLSALNDAARAEVASAEVILSVELYRNVMPWMLPD